MLDVRHALILMAALVAALFLSAVASAPGAAGTTGVLAGTLRLSDGNPVAGAHVTATSPSDSKSVETDSRGYFVFLSLSPDSYTVSASAPGYETVSVPGIPVFADVSRTIALVTSKTTLLGVIKVRGGDSLLRPGVVADVYSVNEEQAEKVQLLGGGGNIDNIYSALSAVPGVVVPPGQNGSDQVISIRGAVSLPAVGYEYDGVPINRSFDNEIATVGSNLGQRELQVYAGSAPPNAEAFGLGGFVNQVLKVGTFPGFADVTATLQSPNLYNGLNVEIGGASPSRSFSYYVAVGGYDYGPRYYDNFNGASQTEPYGAPLDIQSCATDPTRDSTVDCYLNDGVNGPIGPGGIINGPFALYESSTVADRETVVNLHFRLPHRNDAVSDDVQLLYSNSFLNNPVYSSYSDMGTGFWRQDAALGGGLSEQPWAFFSGYQYNGAVGQAIPGGCPAPCNIVPYAFPSSDLPPGTIIPITLRDSGQNADAIIKVQYQHNIGSRAYLRLYGYSYYSIFFEDGPNATAACNASGIAPSCEAISGDYELSTHTHGGSVAYSEQLSDRHLLDVEASLVTATTLRDFNTQFFSAGAFGVLVDANAPTSGLCFQLSGALGSCEPFSNAPASFIGLGHVYGGGVPDISGLRCDPKVPSLAAGPCQWLVVENGPRGPYNQVRPVFTSLSASDQFRASSVLQIDGGLRFDRFEFIGGDTNGPARSFWFNAWNQNECAAPIPSGLPLDKAGDLGLSPTTPCSAAGLVPATMENVSGQVFAYSLVEPRIGGTYTVNPENVLRLSYTEIAQPPLAAYEQYNFSQQNLPAALAPFYPFGFTTPGHELGPSVAYSLDFSWEHRFGGDVEFKLTPYLRKTKDQYEPFILDHRTGLGTELPAAEASNSGVEFELHKGNFSRNGLSWVLTYTYFHNLLSYTPLPSGITFQTATNNEVRLYNSYTSFCARTPADPRCGLPTNGSIAAPCYDSSGAAAPLCATGDIANPYWNAPVQDLIPDGTFRALGRNNMATLVLNYKSGAFSVTPTMQLYASPPYGDPLAATGIDPASQCTALKGSTVGDPRYPYGAPGGSPYDATSCLGQINIPDPYTGLFDATDGFSMPTILLMNLQLSYQASPRLSFTAGIANLVNTCWGGTKRPWTSGATGQTCFYQEYGYAGNFYNPNSIIAPQAQYPYFRYPGAAPISLTFQVSAKL